MTRLSRNDAAACDYRLQHDVARHACRDTMRLASHTHSLAWRHVILRERGSAPERGRHSTTFVPTKCICAVAAWWFDNPDQKVVPRSRIPRSTSHFLYIYTPRGAVAAERRGTFGGLRTWPGRRSRRRRPRRSLTMIIIAYTSIRTFTIMFIIISSSSSSSIIIIIIISIVSLLSY